MNNRPVGDKAKAVVRTGDFEHQVQCAEGLGSPLHYVRTSPIHTTEALAGEEFV